MIDAETARAILDMYKKHGWKLRRVLLSGDPKELFADNSAEIFDGVTPELSQLDALWFSRSSRPQQESWELRHLGSRPFALVRVLDSNAEQAVISDVLWEAEQEMLRSKLLR